MPSPVFLTVGEDDLAAKRQIELVRDVLPDIVQMCREYHERGHRGFALWLDGAPYYFHLATLLHTLPQSTPELNEELKIMMLTYHPQREFVLMTVMPDELLLGIYDYTVVSLPVD